MSDETELAALDKVLDDFEGFLKGKAGKPRLRENWIDLQLFATYGLRLPHTQELMLANFDLKAEEAAKLDWFPGMVDAYGDLNKSSEYFFGEVLSPMIDLGSGLANYASDAAGEDSIFTLVLTLIQPGEDQDLEAVLGFLQDLKGSAVENQDLAQQVKDNLLAYQKQLTSSQTKIGNTTKEIAVDDTVNQEAIDKYQGGPEASDSIKHLRMLLVGEAKRYGDDMDVIKMSASYAWAGWIGAAVATGVDIAHYEDAQSALDAIDDYNAAIGTAEGGLTRALHIQTVDRSATTSLKSVAKHLAIAIEKTEDVQKSWKGVADGLDYLSDKVKNTLKPDGLEDQKLVAIRSIRTYMQQAQSRWADLQPVIESMTNNVIISVETKSLDMDELKERILAQKQMGG